MAKKIAFLIGSPVLGINGSAKDVLTMSSNLERRGFETRTCINEAATRDGILSGWNTLISDASSNDTVVIYYSGHGGRARAPADADPALSRPYQYIIPWDYAESTPDNFLGILDVELSDLLKRTTDKTPNVTLIMDCCHSARMVRGGGGDGGNVTLTKTPREPFMRALTSPSTPHAELVFHEKKVLDAADPRIGSGGFDDENSYAVRIFSAAPHAAAWECLDEEGDPRGIFTWALLETLKDTSITEMTWRAVMFRVKHLVQQQFPQQIPRIEGPFQDRVMFQMTMHTADSIPVKVIDYELVEIYAGSTAGVTVGSVFTIMAHTAAGASNDNNNIERLGEAVVTRVEGFWCEADMVSVPGRVTMVNFQAIAFLKHQAVEKASVSINKDSLADSADALYQRVSASDLVAMGPTPTPLSVHFEKGANGKILGYKKLPSSPPTLSISADTPGEAVAKAEDLIRGQRLLGLKPGSGVEHFAHQISVEFKIAPTQNVLLTDGTGEAHDGDDALITFRNNAQDAVPAAGRRKGGRRPIAYVNVFYVNPWGRVTHISKSWPLGIRLAPGEQWTLGNSGRKRGGTGAGLRLSWPEGFPRERSISETLVCFITRDEIDLRDLARSRPEGVVARGALEDELRAVREVLGRTARPIGSEEESGPDIVPYDVVHVKWTLNPVVRPRLA